VSIDEAMTPRRPVRRMMDGMKQWTGAETCKLIVKAYLWLVCVTAPATTFIVVGLRDLGAIILFFPVAVIITAICALGGGVVSIPFTHLLGRALIRVRSRIVHALTHAVLAGALAAACVELIAFTQGEDLLWPYSLVASAPAGLAAAIARWRLDIVEPSTIPGAEKPERADDEDAEEAAHAR
jgi:hypothetical protein